MYQAQSKMEKASREREEKDEIEGKKSIYHVPSNVITFKYYHPPSESL